jgi:glyoxylase-like metal-dependent hydrolase (beta-lactamase superfamily II)/8-oxo-dGTP pyrophosphatase MutT (NUDIX family)
VTNGPVEPRPAATVVLLREGSAGLEALLTHRPATMAFAPGVHVFPGGQVDAADSASSLVARSVISPVEAAVALGGDLEPEPAHAAFVAAIRELFEEAGVLLADVGGSEPGRDARIGAARSALVRGETTLVELAEDLDLRLRTDRVVPLSRWVTPPSMPRRFDARFFAATLPPGAKATFEGDEVAAHEWLRPTDALAAMAAVRLAMWLPTSATLQQLEHARSIEEIRDRLAPGPLGRIEVAEAADGVTRIVMPAGGGVAGQPVSAYLVGRRRFVLVDPGDPSGPALDRTLALANARSGAIQAVALTHVDPDHAAGAQAVAEILGIPVLVGPGGGASLPYATRELRDLDVLDDGDIGLQVLSTPGLRRDHVAFIDASGRFVIAGDLDGVRGARSIPGPVDPAVLAASVARVRAVAPEALWLAGHPIGREAGPPT